MGDQSSTQTSTEAKRFRAYKRQRHDPLASSYHDFFAPVTALAIAPVLQAAHLTLGAALLDVATGPGALAAEATKRRVQAVGVDLAPGMQRPRANECLFNDKL